MSTLGAFYWLPPGVDVVRMGNGDVVLCSDTAVVRLEGASTSFLVEEVFPLLDGQKSLHEVTTALGLASLDELESYLNRLVESGLARRGDRPLEDPRELSPGFSMLADLGLSASDAHEQLDQCSVGIVGLEGPGAYVALHLAQVGVGKIVLADPFASQPGNLELSLLGDRPALGLPRQAIVRDRISLSRTQVETLNAETELNRDAISDLTAEVDLVIGCFDRGFSATNVWINQASLEHSVAALYARLQGHVALLGPLVVPHKTACYMCWRMRTLACENAFEEAMAYEEFLDRQRTPSMHDRSVLPFLASYAGSVVAGQALAWLLNLTVPPLAGRVHEFNGLTLTSELHPLLQVPDCAACSKKKRPR